MVRRIMNKCLTIPPCRSVRGTQAQPPSNDPSSSTKKPRAAPPPKPAWLAPLEHALVDQGLHANARLFLLQALLNEPASSGLTPWATASGSALAAGVLRVVNDLLLLPPSSSSYFRGGAAGGRGGGVGGCHYLLCDVADLFLMAWGDYRPSARGAWWQMDVCVGLWCLKCGGWVRLVDLEATVD